MYTAIFITVCLHYTSICKHDTTITFAKKHRHQKAIPSFEPSQYLALTGSSGPEWPFVYKEKAFWLEWMLSSGRRHFLASILPSSIEIGTWPPKFVNDTSPYWRHPTFPLVAMTTWSETESIIRNASQHFLPLGPPLTRLKESVTAYHFSFHPFRKESLLPQKLTAGTWKSPQKWGESSSIHVHVCL